MRTKEVSECAITSERTVFILNGEYQWFSNLQLIPLVSVVWGWWHQRQANDAVASKPSIFSENHYYKNMFPCRCEHVYIIIRTYNYFESRNVQDANPSGQGVKGQIDPNS